MDSDRLIAFNDEAELFALGDNPQRGYAIIKESGKKGPEMPVASILSMGDWEMVDEKPKKPKMNIKQLFFHGGRGSGNFGHQGRPGQVGGSQKRGNSTRSISSFLTTSTFDDFSKSPSKVQFVKDKFQSLMESLGFSANIEILDDKTFNDKFKNAKISEFGQMMGGANTITAGYNSRDNVIYLRDSRIKNIASSNDYRLFKNAVYHEMGHAFHSNVWNMKTVGGGEYGSSFQEKFADEFSGNLAYFDAIQTSVSRGSTNSPFYKPDFDFDGAFAKFIREAR